MFRVYFVSESSQVEHKSVSPCLEVTRGKFSVETVQTKGRLGDGNFGTVYEAWAYTRPLSAQREPFLTQKHTPNIPWRSLTPLQHALNDP